MFKRTVKPIKFFGLSTRLTQSKGLLQNKSLFKPCQNRKISSSKVTLNHRKMSDFIYPNKTPIALLDCEASFKELTEKEKLYAHYLSRASWIGGLIVLFQTSLESSLIHILLQKLFHLQPPNDLKQVALQECGLTEEEFKAFLIYASAIFYNSGNYKGMGDTKFIPNLPQEKFHALLSSSKFAKEHPQDFEKLISRCKDKIYSHEDNECCLGFPAKGVTTYLSKNVTEDDNKIVKKFMIEQGIEPWNTRLFKTVEETGSIRYEIRLASVLQPGDEEDGNILSEHTFEGHKFVVSRGDYSKLLELVNWNLSIAKGYAANENEQKMLENYIHSFRTGSLKAHKDGSRYWVKNKGPIVESYIGFIENYRDPAGMRAEFEGFSAVVNKKMSVKFYELVNTADKFLPMLPWPSAYHKETFTRPDFTSLDVVTFAGSDIPAGICIPNYDEVKEKDGFKNVSLGNVINVRPIEAPNYLVKSDQDMLMEHLAGAFELTVGLHELLGHGSGKQFKKEKDGTYNFDVNNVLNYETNEKATFYAEGETYESVFGALSSAMEECRAECVALSLTAVPDILKIFGYEGEIADTIVYTSWLSMVLSGLQGLQMYDIKSKSWLQAHSQARFGILQVCLESGEDFVKIEPRTGEDGQLDLLLTLDKTKILSVGKPAIDKFLSKIQLYRSTADYASARALFDKYTSVTDEGLHAFILFREIVMARRKPRKLFVQHNTVVEDGKVVLKTYESTPEGMIQSWMERFHDASLHNVLEELWAKDKPYFS